MFQKSILNLAIETEATVEEETVSCEITTPFQSVDSPTLQHPESQLIGGNEFGWRLVSLFICPLTLKPHRFCQQ